MSVPRRKPPSTITGARPRTPATTSGRHAIVARRLFSARPPWFDTNSPLTPCSHRELGVLARDDALDEHLHRRRVLEPLHELPRRRADFGDRRARRELARASACDGCRALVRRAAASRASACRPCGSRAVARIAPARRAASSRGCCRRCRSTVKTTAGAPGALGALDHLPRLIPVLPGDRAETRPARRAPRSRPRSSVVVTVDSTCRWSFGLRRARHGDFAFRMKRLLAADRIDARSACPSSRRASRPTDRSC